MKWYFPLIMILSVSCIFRDLENAKLVASGDASRFVKDGFSLPVYGITLLEGDLPVVSEVKMVQVNVLNYARIPVVNPGILAMTYTVTTDKPELFLSMVNATGSFSSVHHTIPFEFILNQAADKNDITLTLTLVSTMRTYDAHHIALIHINTRPSSVIAVKNNSGDKIEAGIWNPVIADNKATIYWDYVTSVTDTDIKNLVISYTVNGNKLSEEILYSQDSGLFGTNSFTVNDIQSDDTLSFSFTVYDDEGLSSYVMGSGDTSIYKSSEPGMTRGSGDDLNDITVTADTGSELYVAEGESAFNLVTSPYILELSAIHTIKAFTKTTNKIDSAIITNVYSYLHPVMFETNGGSAVESTGVSHGEKVTKPADPVRDGYLFDGWYKDAALTTLWDFDADTVTSSTTLYALWIEKPTGAITFAVNPEFPVLVFTPSEITVDAGANVPITTSSSFSTAQNWQWYENNIKVAGESLPSFTFNSAGKTGTNLIWCSVELDGLLYSGTVRITVKP